MVTDVCLLSVKTASVAKARVQVRKSPGTDAEGKKGE